MQIIILAGGEGKRMWPIQTDKCLIPFLGKPLIYHNLLKIRENLGTAEFIIVATPQNKNQVSEIAQVLGLKFSVVAQQQPKGMADALLSAKDLINGEVLVVNAEDILDLTKVETNGDVLLRGLKVNKYFPGGYIENVKGQNSKVKSIVEKPGEGNEPSDLVKLVADYFKDGKKLIEYLEKVSSENDDVYEMALGQMIKDGLDIRFSKYDGVWLPLKYPWHILDIMKYFLDKIETEDKVLIEEGAKVFEGAVIKGPCYIGKNCIVGNNSIVRESNLEEGCVTGFSSDITRSYIGANCWFHTNYIGDSVIEGDLGMGSGAVLANLRLDNKTITIKEHGIDTGRSKLGLIAGIGVRIGVNASTMPGVRVGSNCLIGPGVVLKQDLKENKKITLKQESFEIEDYQASQTSYDQFRDNLK
ncbi:NTP transferase domain-containing protein [Candidatus Daviesbacteria bacterium]|nr:NTP transferase domain-containing protein [Candidatus Daviesbacteria bacterium]